MGKGAKPHRSKRSRKGKGPTGAGRPRKDRPRYANGKIKPEVFTPNDRTIALRRALLGNPGANLVQMRAAENPLDLARARGWLLEELHAAGRLFMDWHASANLSAPKPRTADPEPRIRSGAIPRSDAVALWRVAEVFERLQGRPRCYKVLVAVCLLEEWPDWLWSAAMSPTPPDLARLEIEPERNFLIAALGECARVSEMRPPEDLARGSDLSRFIAWQRGDRQTQAA